MRTFAGINRDEIMRERTLMGRCVDCKVAERAAGKRRCRDCLRKARERGRKQRAKREEQVARAVALGSPQPCRMCLIRLPHAGFKQCWECLTRQRKRRARGKLRRFREPGTGCPKCKRRPVTGDEYACAHCRAVISRMSRRRYRRHLAAGMCPECGGKRPIDDGHASCTPCRRQKRHEARAKLARHRASGGCHRCGRPNPGRWKLCPTCRAKSRGWRRDTRIHTHFDLGGKTRCGQMVTSAASVRGATTKATTDWSDVTCGRCLMMRHAVTRKRPLHAPGSNGRPACNLVGGRITTDPGDVTCGRCLNGWVAKT